MIPTGTLNESAYALINGAIVASGFSDVSTYYKTAFADYFSQPKWSEFFVEATPSIDNTYTQLIGEKYVPVMARYVSYDGEVPKISTDGFEVKSKDMPRMKQGFDINEKSNMELRKLQQEIRMVQARGVAADVDAIFSNFTVNVGKLLQGIHNQITYTALQILSTGKYTSTPQNNGGGLEGLEFDFGVPAANKLKCGQNLPGTKFAWSSASAYPIGDLQGLTKYAEDNFIDIAELCMNKATWYIIRDHATTRTNVAIQVTGGSVSDTNLTKYAVTDEQIMTYMVGLGIPPIRVIDDKFQVMQLNMTTRKMERKNLRGFADGVVVGRPAGAVGDLQWSLPDLSFGTVADPIYTSEGGKFSVQQVTDPKKKSQEYIAEFTGITVPSKIDQMLYLDITTAAD